MTDQSRSEAVARALAVRYQHNPDKAWEDYIEDAQAAISANDAWLKERGWEPGQKGYSRYAMFAGIHRNPEEV